MYILYIWEKFYLKFPIKRLAISQKRRQQPRHQSFKTTTAISKTIDDKNDDTILTPISSVTTAKGQNSFPPFSTVFFSFSSVFGGIAGNFAIHLPEKSRQFFLYPVKNFLPYTRVPKIISDFPTYAPPLPENILADLVAKMLAGGTPPYRRQYYHNNATTTPPVIPP